MLKKIGNAFAILIFIICIIAMLKVIAHNDRIDKEHAQQVYKQIEELMDNGKYEEASNVYEKDLKLNGSELYDKMNIFLESKKRFEEASEYLRKGNYLSAEAKFKEVDSMAKYYYSKAQEELMKIYEKKRDSAATFLEKIEIRNFTTSIWEKESNDGHSNDVDYPYINAEITNNDDKQHKIRFEYRDEDQNDHFTSQDFITGAKDIEVILSPGKKTEISFNANPQLRRLVLRLQFDDHLYFEPHSIALSNFEEEIYQDKDGKYKSKYVQYVHRIDSEGNIYCDKYKLGHLGGRTYIFDTDEVEEKGYEKCPICY